MENQVRNPNSLNVIVPACGLGQRFIDAGHTTPKPFISVAGHPMVQWVLDSIPDADHAVVLLQHGTPEALGRRLLPGVRVVGLSMPEYARGAAETVLCATKHIPLTEQVLVVNCDNVILPFRGWANIIADWRSAGAVGGIFTFRPAQPGPFSYLRESAPRVVAEVAEKTEIGPYACAGAFWFSSYALLHAVANMHMKGEPDFHKEYYLAPVYNHLIKNGLTVMHYTLEEEDLFVRIGTPEDLTNAEDELNHAHHASTI